MRMQPDERFKQTRFLDVEEDGREWVCVPLAPGDDVPAVLRQVADEWERTR